MPHKEAFISAHLTRQTSVSSPRKKVFAHTAGLGKDRHCSSASAFMMTVITSMVTVQNHDHEYDRHHLPPLLLLLLLLDVPLRHHHYCHYFILPTTTTTTTTTMQPTC